jgi:phosphatidylserine decarboxylase
MTSLETPGLATPTVKYRMPSVHPEGIKYVVIAAGLTLIAFLLWDVLGWLFVMLTIWVAAFFRDPLRVTPQGDGLVVSPADGLVTMIQEMTPPRELTVGEEGIPPEPAVRVSIFMSVFDVHINRAPIAGRVTRVVYIPGKFLNADLDKASEDNERQHFVVESANGERIAFTQIAGLVARRIVKFAKEGDTVAAGQRIGLIRFGSRVDVYLPAGVAPQVALGQRAIAGETILGRAGDGVAAHGVTQ